MCDACQSSHASCPKFAVMKLKGKQYRQQQCKLNNTTHTDAHHVPVTHIMRLAEAVATAEGVLLAGRPQVTMTPAAAACCCMSPC